MNLGGLVGLGNALGNLGAGVTGGMANAQQTGLMLGLKQRQTDVDMLKANADMLKAGNDLSKTDTERKIQAMTWGAQLAASAHDQPTWDRARGTFVSMFPEYEGTIPPQYDPRVRDQLGMMAISAAERFKAEREMAMKQIPQATIKEGQNPDGTLSYYSVGAGGATPIPGSPNAPPPVSAATVNIDQKGNSAEAVAMGQALVDDYKKVSEAADDGTKTIGSLSIARAMDVSTGAFAPAKTQAANVLQALGIDPARAGLENATNAQAFTGIMNEVILTKAGQMKGQLSDRDIVFLKGSVPNLTNTVEANRFLIDAGIALAERAVERKRFYDDFMAKNGTLKGASSAWAEYVRTTPVLLPNPSVGRPMFFREYAEKMREVRPDATDEQIMATWRQHAQSRR